MKTYDAVYFEAGTTGFNVALVDYNYVWPVGDRDVADVARQMIAADIEIQGKEWETPLTENPIRKGPDQRQYKSWFLSGQHEEIVPVDEEHQVRLRCAPVVLEYQGLNELIRCLCCNTIVGTRKVFLSPEEQEEWRKKREAEK